jgi:hypothetical protein
MLVTATTGTQWHAGSMSRARTPRSPSPSPASPSSINLSGGRDPGTSPNCRNRRPGAVELELEAQLHPPLSFLSASPLLKSRNAKLSWGFRQKRYKPSEKLLAAGVVSQRAHHGTVRMLPGPLGPRAGPGRSGHGVASHHWHHDGTHGLRGWGLRLSGRRNDVIQIARVSGETRVRWAPGLCRPATRSWCRVVLGSTY